MSCPTTTEAMRCRMDSANESLGREDMGTVGGVSGDASGTRFGWRNSAARAKGGMV